MGLLRTLGYFGTVAMGGCSSVVLARKGNTCSSVSVSWPIAKCYLPVAACLCGICQPLPMPGTGACSKMLFAFGREHVVVHAYHHGYEHDRVVEKM